MVSILCFSVQKSIQKSVCVHPYSTPRPGGQIEYDDELGKLYPYFFDRLSKFRSIVPEILSALCEEMGVCISPVALENQRKLNKISADACRNNISI